MADAEVVLSPGEAARQLGVSPSGLRRLAVVYGEVYGELKKGAGGTSRVWPREAVVRLQAARALMAAGQARSVRDALMAVEGGAAPPVEMVTAGGDVVAALGVVATRLEALQDSNQRLEAEVLALRSEVAELRALPPGATPERIDRSLEVEVKESRTASENIAATQENLDAVKPQRREHESWIAEATLEALVGASELPSEAQGNSDGLMVRAARWLERRLRGRDDSG